MTIDYSDLGDTKFPIGKYQGEPIWSVADEDPRYIEWFINNTTQTYSFYKKLKQYYNWKFPHGY